MKYAYYPGCSLHSTGIEYNISTKAVAKHLGVELWEIPDWNCCGASAAHNTNHLLALALAARNLALAEREGLDLAVPCAACFNRMKHAEAAVRAASSTRQAVAEAIEMDYKASNNTYAMLDLFSNHVPQEELRAKVVKPLTGLKAACYYGCLLVRPPKVTGFDDPENPNSMDRLLGNLGATPVEWSYKVECCGAGHSSTKPEVATHMLDAIFRDAVLNGAECLVTACPLCFLNLDMRQAEVRRASGSNYNLPVFYFTELMGLALSYSPKELGITRHFVDPLPLINAKDLLRHPTTRREEA